MNRYLVAILGATMASMTLAASANPDGQQLFSSKCAMCHALDQKKMGPSVKSMSTDAEALRTAIAKGKNSMPAFAGKLSDVEIAAVVDYLKANQ
jgi:mono/diheme cytochrome c family protein